MARKRATSRKRKAAPWKAAPAASAPHAAAKPELKGEGRLTNHVLKQKLRRGKGPLVHIGLGFGFGGHKHRSPDEIKRGLR